MDNWDDGGNGLFGGEEAGVSSFDRAHYIVVPAPLEQSVSYGGGTARGPAAIVRASAELEFFNEETGKPYWGDGDVHTTPPVIFDASAVFGPHVPPDKSAVGAAAVAQIADAVYPVLAAGKFPIVLGGEHTVTVGALMAVSKHAAMSFQQSSVGLVVIDAHLDLRAEYDDNQFSHACVARRAIEDFGMPVAWCGIRSYSAEEAEVLAERKLEPLHAHDIPDGCGQWISDFVATLPDQVYLSIDIDGLDPTEAPGTGTPEPGGLRYRQVLGLIREVVTKREVVGADVVEVAPIQGQQVTEFLAARLIAKLIGHDVAKQQSREQSES